MQPKERKFIEALAAGKNKTDAAIIATGNTNRKAASVKAQRMLSKVSNSKYYQDLLKKHNITFERALKPIGDALEATTVHIVGNGDQAMAEEVIDHKTRLQASDRALKLLGITKLNDIRDNPYDEETETYKSGLDEVEMQRLIFRKGTQTD